MPRLRRPDIGALVVCLVLLAPLLAPSPALAVDVQDTRLLTQPAVSAEHVAFVYAGDLWVAPLDPDGAVTARRLTSHEGQEGNPVFSPDGRWIAFDGEYDGNLDVYVMPVEGGMPTRLTWHPGGDEVLDWTPDGSAVLFRSSRRTHTWAHTKLYTVPVAGGFPTELPVPHGARASYHAGGERLAYTPLSEAFRQWQNYRGGRVTRIWLLDLDDLSVDEVPQPEGRSNDARPLWIGDQVFFLSDRDGILDVYSFDPASGEVRRRTTHDDFPVLHHGAGGGHLVYEQAGYLHLLDPATDRSRKLTIGVPADLPERRPRHVAVAEDVRNGGLSPSGTRAVLEARGEIFTLPADKGAVRNLTGTQGVHERSPIWSPDGAQIAYFSDAGGEYRLHVAPQDGRGEPEVFALGGAGFYEKPRWSPDGGKISFQDNSRSLYVLDLESGRVRKISSEPVYGPVDTLTHSWSPDSRWIAYTRNNSVYFQTIHLYSVDEDRSHALTDGLADAGDPVFSSDGKFLYFTASTDAGPIRQWFAQSIADARSTSSLYLAVLSADEPSPLAPENDEEPISRDDEGEDEDENEGDEDEGEGEDDEPARVRIDLDGLAQRIVALPLAPAAYGSLAAGNDGSLFYLKARELSLNGGPSALARFDLDEREETVLAQGVVGFELSGDRTKVLVGHPGQPVTWQVASATGGEISGDDGTLRTDELLVKIDPAAEWAQIYDEAWRINRDYFYDPGMHGADWPAVKARYAALLPHLATRRDLTRVMRWMASELSVGHSYLGGGDERLEPEEVEGGLLGADFRVADDRYQFARVFGGLNWNPDLRAPLAAPGAQVEAGEYLLAVEGEELRPPENVYSRFEDTAGRIVEITVGPNPDGSGSRTLEVMPVDSETPLRNRAWVEDNLARVTEATDGRVAYVYVPNTANLGHTYFKRYFYPQANRQAIIVDERHNGGGSVADYYIDLLRRPLISWWATRYGDDVKTPIASIQGPKVMLIDETAGSGGDLLPWMFRQLEMGPIIGKRTWGGLVGILGFPVLMDGGQITAPNLGFWTEEEGFGVENVGVPPDIEVEQWPAEMVDGGDPQLERAIQEALRLLEANPPDAPQRPPFPVRARPSGEDS